MRIAFKTLLLTAAIGLGSAAHGAEPAGHAEHHPRAAAPAPASSAAANPSGTPSGSMMGGGMMGMGAMSCAGMTADRLAALKGELALTRAQLPLWDAFADAAQGMGRGMGMQQGMGMSQGMPMQPGAGMKQGMPMQPGAGMQQGMGSGQPGMGMMGQAGSLPERLDRQETMLTARLDAVHKMKAALTPLYAALTPEQKAKIDAAMCGSQGR
jgi:hypothetical protein